MRSRGGHCTRMPRYHPYALYAYLALTAPVILPDERRGARGVPRRDGIMMR